MIPSFRCTGPDDTAPPPPGEGLRVQVTRPVPLQPGPPRRARQVLLVDDDEFVRLPVESFLKRLGLVTHSVGSGPEALALVASGAPVDLAVLDVVMPDMDGMETLARLRMLRPDLPVLFITGFMDERLAALLSGQPNLRLLRKPFGLEALAEALTGWR